MRVALLSDLHVEFHADHGKSLAESLDPSICDVLVLAGDIGTVAYSRLQGFLERLVQRYSQIVYVTGNHEYYGATRADVDSALSAFSKRAPNFHWLDDGVVEILGQRFVGSTLWFGDPDGDNGRYEQGLNDFWMIKGGFRDWVYAKNSQSIRFLVDTVRLGDVVVTHHIPHQRGTHRRWHRSPLNRFFVNKLPDELLARPKLWFYGHTHDSMAWSHGACEFHSNPLGYPHEPNVQFNEKLVFDV